MEQGDRHLDLRLASDYVRGELDDGGDLPQIPPLRVGAGLHYDQNRWHLGVQAFYYDEQDKVGGKRAAHRQLHACRRGRELSAAP